MGRNVLIEGFTFGFEGIIKSINSNNLKSTFKFPEVVQKKISKEVKVRVHSWSFWYTPFPNICYIPPWESYPQERERCL